jgi:DNA-binding NarL/FixJ family response regulator
MSPALTILVADDHPLFRCGLCQTIEADSRLRIIYQAGNGRTALQGIREHKPDLCILDIRMPEMDGLAVVRQMRAQHLRTEIILLTAHQEEEFLSAALDLGVKGYVLKESAVTDILDAIRTVMAGHRYISPTLADLVFERRAGADALREERPGLEQLTPSERRILKCIAEDKTSKEIADELGLSPHTIENHRTNICAKLDVHGVHGLVKFAYANRSRL